MTGSVDSPGVHYGLLGIADDLVLSPLDDRFFVASSGVVVAGSAVGTSGMADRLGDRSTWPADVGGPTDHAGLCRASVGAVSRPNPIPFDTDSGERFLPRVVDRRDWTIRPLSVPDDATRGFDDPPARRRAGSGSAPPPTAVMSDSPTPTTAGRPGPMSSFPRRCAAPARSWECRPRRGRVLVVAASGDHVAVTQPWGGSARPVYVSADAGENWNTVLLDPD